MRRRYYRGLAEYDETPGFLRNTFRHFQDLYYDLSCTRLVPRAFEDLLDIGRDPWRGFDRLAVDLDGDVA